MFLFFKKALVLFVLFMMATGCHRIVETGEKTIVVGSEAYPENIDPRLGSDAMSAKISHLIFNGLFRLDDNLNVVPDLAESYRQIDDRTYEIQLRPKVLFHHGKELIAEDVIATYQSILDPELKSPRKAVFEKIEKMEVLSSHRFRLRLTEPFAPIFTSLMTGILPKEFTGAAYQPIGTGPYVHESAARGEKVVLRRWNSYFGAPAKNERLVFRTILDDTLRTLELIKGRLDLVQNSIPFVLLPAIKERAQPDKDHQGFNLSNGPGINFAYLGFNLRNPILKERSVREAIALAVNREDVIHYKLKDYATPATSLLFPGHWAFNPDLIPYSYDPEKAKKLLDGAGYSDPDGDGPKSRFKMTYKTSTKRDRVEIALLIAYQLKKIGIDVEVKSYEWGTFSRDIRTGNFELFSSLWVGLTEPDIYYTAFHSQQIPPEGANRGYYSNPEVDKLVEQGRLQQNTEKRKEIYGKVQAIIFQDLPYVPLWYEHNWVVMQKGVKGYELTPNASFENLVRSHKQNGEVGFGLVELSHE